MAAAEEDESPRVEVPVSSWMISLRHKFFAEVTHTAGAGRDCYVEPCPPDLRDALVPCGPWKEVTFLMHSRAHQVFEAKKVAYRQQWKRYELHGFDNVADFIKFDDTNALSNVKRFAAGTLSVVVPPICAEWRVVDGGREVLVFHIEWCTVGANDGSIHACIEGDHAPGSDYELLKLREAVFEHLLTLFEDADACEILHLTPERLDVFTSALTRATARRQAHPSDSVQPV